MQSAVKSLAPESGNVNAQGNGRGPIMAIGGAEDKSSSSVILKRFYDLSGGEAARIVIVPTASSIEAAGERYKAIFLEMGAATASVAYIADREDANRDENVELISEASGVFLTGGNQLRLAAIVGGTKVAQAVRQQNDKGAVVAGTSAGASILSSYMVAFGSSGAVPKQRMAQMVAGFGLVPDVILDQHFRQRDRIGRLLMLVASNPGLLGVGIDEDTAVIVGSDAIMEVLGRNSVTIVDGSEMNSDVYRVKGHGSITLSNARLHILGSGRRFDLKSRTLMDREQL